MTDEIKKEISQAAVKLAEYVHDKKFEAIIVSGGSNQLSRSLFTLAWQSRFKGEPMPHIYKFGKDANYMMYKSDATTADLRPRIRDWIAVNLPELEEIKNHKLCYVDDFAMTGGKYIELRRRFGQLGFDHLKFAFFGATPISELGKDVFVGTLDMETTWELQTLSLEIKDEPSLHDLLHGVELEAGERRLNALKAIKELGQTIRMK